MTYLFYAIPAVIIFAACLLVILKWVTDTKYFRGEK